MNTVESWHLNNCVTYSQTFTVLFIWSAWYRAVNASHTGLKKHFFGLFMKCAWSWHLKQCLHHVAHELKLKVYIIYSHHSDLRARGLQTCMRPEIQDLQTIFLWPININDWQARGVECWISSHLSTGMELRGSKYALPTSQNPTLVVASCAACTLVCLPLSLLCTCNHVGPNSTHLQRVH